jgi:hypothetical protein
MALISPQAMAVTGTSPTFTQPTASDTIRPTDRGVLLVRTTGTATTATFTVPGNTTFGQAQPDVAVTNGATDIKAIPMTAYVNAVDANGLVAVAFSGALTGVTAAYVTI